MLSEQELRLGMENLLIEGLPIKVNEENIWRSVNYFLSQHGISEKIIHIKYLGGCSNHALKVTIKNGNGLKENLLVRLPGSYSELMVNRYAERINTGMVAKLGICPPFAQQFTVDGNVLQEEGYKVEEFLENASALTHETFYQYRHLALQQLKTVHQSGLIFETEYNLIERIKLMCYSLQDVNGDQVHFLPYQKEQKFVSIKNILIKINYLEMLFRAFGPVKKVPCHNDIPPFNFMRIVSNDGTINIKIIDWEYSGMNDPMCELAYIANENGYHTRKKIIELLHDYFGDEKIDADELQEYSNRVLFYLPLIDLKVAVWALMQVYLCNQSQYIDELRLGWGPERYEKYLEKIKSVEYSELIIHLESILAQSVVPYSIFTK